MPSQNKITNIERDRRVNLIYDLLVLGTSRAQIIQYASEKAWNVTDRQIDHYIQRANQRFEEESKVHQAHELGKAVRRLNDLYQKTLKVQDYRQALANQRELNALLGLYAPSKSELKVSINIEILTRFEAIAKEAGIDPAQALEEYIQQIHALQSTVDTERGG